MSGGVSSIPCDVPLTGRYVTLQRVADPGTGETYDSAQTISWQEVVMDAVQAIQVILADLP